MKRFVNFCIALVFFGGALGLGASTLYRQHVEGAGSVISPASPQAGKSTTNESVRSTRRAKRKARKANRRRDWAPRNGPVEQVGNFFNNTLGLSRMDISFVDILSLVFGFMGTIFTYRSYRIQKRSAEAVAQTVRS